MDRVPIFFASLRILIITTIQKIMVKLPLLMYYCECRMEIPCKWLIVSRAHIELSATTINAGFIVNGSTECWGGREWCVSRKSVSRYKDDLWQQTQIQLVRTVSRCNVNHEKWMFSILVMLMDVNDFIYHWTIPKD